MISGKLLDKRLTVFFWNALRVAVRNPRQAVSFARTLLWLRRSARARTGWKRKGVPVPPIIIFSITNRCNLACRGCYANAFHPSVEDELGRERMLEIIREAEALGVSFFVIAGGEPFLRSELLEAARLHPKVVFLVFTNGLLIDEALLARLRRNRNVVPLVSFEGGREETDARRGEGTYAVLSGLLDRMEKAGLFFGTSLTLTRGNFDRIMDDLFVGRLASAGCRFFLFIEYTPVTRDTEDWVLTEAQRSGVRARLEAWRSRFPSLFIAVPWDEDDVGGCLSAGRGFVHINSRGDLEPCPFAPLSDTNVRDQSLARALQSEFFERIRAVPALARETGGGCVLWKERELVTSLLEAGRTEGESARSRDPDPYP